MADIEKPTAAELAELIDDAHGLYERLGEILMGEKLLHVLAACLSAAAIAAKGTDMSKKSFASLAADMWPEEDLIQ